MVANHAPHFIGLVAPVTLRPGGKLCSLSRVAGRIIILGLAGGFCYGLGFACCFAGPVISLLAFIIIQTESAANRCSFKFFTAI